MSEGPFQRDTEHENIPEEMRKSLRNEYFLNDWSSRTIHFSLILFFFVFLFFVYLFIYLFFFFVFFFGFLFDCFCFLLMFFFVFIFCVFCLVVFVFLFVCFCFYFFCFNGQLWCFRVVVRKCYRKRYSSKFRKIYWAAPVPHSLFSITLSPGDLYTYHTHRMTPFNSLKT